MHENGFSFISLMENCRKFAILGPDLNQNFHKMYKTKFISEKESTGRKPVKTLNLLLYPLST